MRGVKLLRDFTLVVVALISVVGAVLAFYFHAGFLTITSRSMEPTIKAGDMVLTRLAPIDEIQMRDVVVLPVPENPALRYAHRVIAIEKKSNGFQVKTKGDANPNADSWNMVVKSRDVTEVLAVIPTAKIFSGAIERKWIYYGLFYGGALLALYGAWRLVKK
jgi:signal peptidase